MRCYNCHNEIPAGSSYCPVCGVRLGVFPRPDVVSTPSAPQEPKVIYVKEQRRGNGIGTAGFVLSLISMLTFWFPVYGWIIGGILGILGFVFSFVGVFRSPRGLAIAGLICVVTGVLIAINVTAGLIEFITEL